MKILVPHETELSNDIFILEEHKRYTLITTADKRIKKNASFLKIRLSHAT